MTLGDSIDNVVPFRARPVRPRRDLAPLRAALRDLRREIDERFPEPASVETSRGFDAFALFDELRERLGRLGLSERSAGVDTFGLDPVALAESRGLLDWLVERYWRVTLRGVERLPANGPILFVANHSGLVPWDGLVFAHCLQRERSDWPRVRFLIADWLITLPFAQPWLARLGGVRACRENADTLLRQGKSVLAFPEGEKGATKDFGSRYELQRFGRGGAVRAALARGVPLVPVGIVGAEETVPVLFKSPLLGRALGLPFLPVTPMFPVLGPLGLVPLPAKWHIEIGEPLELAGRGPSTTVEEAAVSRWNEALRVRVRELVDRGLAARESSWR